MLGVMADHAKLTSSIDLSAVMVRPTWGAPEHRRWDRLMNAHHYLGFRAMFGKSLRHVATLGETWLALIGWQTGAFRLGPRDRWIGWSREQQFRRLHLIANNARFVILTSERVPNLASRVLGLSLRRLSDDIQEAHGYPVLLAETFVDTTRFHGTCYRAANWSSLGTTSGFARDNRQASGFRHHGQPKEIFMYTLANNAQEALSQADIPSDWKAKQGHEPPSAPVLQSLFEFLATVPDPRGCRGKRYQLATLLAIAVAARMSGYRGISAFGQFASYLTQEQLKALGAFWSPTRMCYTAPTTTTFHSLFATLPPDTLDDAIGRWCRQRIGTDTPLAMDGKDLRCASKQSTHGKRIMVAAVEHQTGIVLGQTEVNAKSNEITAVRELAKRLDIAGRVVTLDAMHAQHTTMHNILEQGADYLVTAVKTNQRTIHEDLKAIDFAGAPRCETIDKGHGRIEIRRCAAIDISGPDWDDYAALYGRRQAIRIQRTTEDIKTGEVTNETTWCLTSLAAEDAKPDLLLDLVRNHWTVESVHHIRDVTYDEDRCRAHKHHMPRNLACISNVAIAIVRSEKRFTSIPEANRHYSHFKQEAIDRILTPPDA